MRTWIIAIALTSAATLPSAGWAQLYGSAEAMPLRRCDFSDTVLQRGETAATTSTPSTVGINVLLGARDVQQDFVAAGRITIGDRLTPDGFGVEGSYFLTSTAAVTAAAHSAAALMASPFSVPGYAPDPILDNNTSVRVDYRSQLQSGDVHFTNMVYEEADGDVMLLAGLRAIGLDETCDYLSKNATQTNDLFAKVNNRLIGPQFGLLARTPVPTGYLSLRLKGALLWNEMSEDVLVNGTPGHVDTSAGSLAGEFGFDYWFAPSPRVMLRMGYQVFGLTGIGLASENLVASPLVTSVNTGGALYHGPTLGAVFNY